MCRVQEGGGGGAGDKGGGGGEGGVGVEGKGSACINAVVSTIPPPN